MLHNAKCYFELIAFQKDSSTLGECDVLNVTGAAVLVAVDFNESDLVLLGVKQLHMDQRSDTHTSQ